MDIISSLLQQIEISELDGNCLKFFLKLKKKWYRRYIYSIYMENIGLPVTVKFNAFS